MKTKQALISIVLLGGAVLVYVVMVGFTLDRQASEDVQQDVRQEILATSTEATSTQEQTQEKKTAPAPSIIYVPQKDTSTTPSIDINNGVKNQGSGTINVYQAPQQTDQLAGGAPAVPFVEPTPQTPLQIANQIVQLYDPNGIAEMYGDTKIRVYAFGGKNVTIDLTQGWEERLKLTLNKIK